jgi:hypothetical protein
MAKRLRPDDPVRRRSLRRGGRLMLGLLKRDLALAVRAGGGFGLSSPSS